MNVREEGIGAGLQWMMGLRVMVVTLFLGLYLFLFPAPIFPYLIAFIYLISIGYAVLYRLIPHQLLAYLQTLGDLILITALVAMTGGVESPFAFLYLISIIASAVLTSRAGAMTTASTASIFFGLVVDSQYFHLFSFLPKSGLPVNAVFYMLFLNIAAYFAVAYLGSSLTVSIRRMKRELQEKVTNLGELQAFNENVVRSMSSGLVTTDMRGMVTSFNRAAEEITGYTFEEVRGKSWASFFPLREIRSIFESKPELRSSWRFDGEIFRKDGNHRIVGVTVSLLKDESGQNKGVIGIFQDLTQIVEMEAEVKKREKMAMVGELAAGMAHEIRNPLASLSGSMQVLRKELTLEGENERLMEIALREAERLNTKITQFLAYARPAPLQKKVCNIHELIRDTLTLLGNHEEYREEVMIQASLADDLFLPVDPGQMSQVFWNLALNALQSMPEGGTLSVSSRILPGDPAEVEINFKDTGEGMEASLLDKIFVPFFTTKERGSGLGLPMVHRIIEDHGGKLRVMSRVGKGTEFRIHLPLEPLGVEDGAYSCR
ncbi:MAG: PAS domain S-box protein [Nitrospirae bacterium]|nr:PAS domain S-box protein [Nitrospirota bacterium]